MEKLFLRNKLERPSKIFLVSLLFDGIHDTLFFRALLMGPMSCIVCSWLSFLA
jgi:hypothetical protein